MYLHLFYSAAVAAVASANGRALRLHRFSLWCLNSRVPSFMHAAAAVRHFSHGDQNTSPGHEVGTISAEKPGR